MGALNFVVLVAALVVVVLVVNKIREKKHNTENTSNNNGVGGVNQNDAIGINEPKEKEPHNPGTISEVNKEEI